ncbi:MAG: winged helix DNA-binding protein [Nitrososphaerota archaeon]|jgi:DNA-binding MarR family transcriptional regulator|nr:winged helix DNA-binding protein [Nitrososphaerota archaeon]
MNQIKEQFVQLALKIKRHSILAIAEMDNIYPVGLNINLSEFFLLHNVAKTASENTFSLLDFKNNNCLSKSGVSKMLGTLEEKGYLVRNLDKNDRRKLVVTVTEKGCKAIELLDSIVDDYLTEYINSVGEEYLTHLFEIINNLEKVNEKVIEKMKNKYFKTNQIGE